MTSLPAGEVTLVFTDVEGSTRAWEQHPDAMPVALARHVACVHHAIEAEGGVVVKDTGDGVFAVFPHAEAAVRAAVELQLGLQATAWNETGPLRARVGVHSGDAAPEHGDYHAACVNRCSRLMDAAHGGQILVSEATRARISNPPPGVEFRDLGWHRLQDLSSALRLFQVLHPDLPAQFPPVRSLDRRENNLPYALSSFVGREAALAEVGALVAEHRLVTLVGAGGVGKSRLALQVAADRAMDYADGVWLAPLAALEDAALVPHAVATSLGVADHPGRTWLESLTWYLRDRRVLVVVDNCDHLLDAVASLVETLLSGCRDVHVVATSREPLHLPGEVAWRVPSLSVPDGERRDSEAERLFTERALEVEPRFRRGPDDDVSIAQICCRLGGVPLAVELAAARIRVLSPAEIASRLDDRFRLLTAERRVTLPRQRTLEATIGWSYDLCTRREQVCFDRLSVLPGGATLDAAEQVCGRDPLQPEEILSLLTTLTDRSLVVHVARDSSSRYELLETMRAYGHERLVSRGEVALARDALLAWADEFARHAESELDGLGQQEWLGRVAAEIDNIRAALAWSADGGDRDLGLGTAASLFRYWYIRGVREGRHWLERLLDADTSDAVRAKGLSAAGQLAETMGDCDRASALLHESLDLYRRVGNERGLAWALQALGTAEWDRIDPQALHAHFVEALTIFRRLPDRVGTAFALQLLAVWELEWGELSRSVEYADELDRIVRELANPHLVAHAAEICGGTRWLARQDIDRAFRELREALELHRRIGSETCCAHCLDAFATVAADLGEARLGAQLHGAADRLRDDNGTVLRPYNTFARLRGERVARDALGPAAYAEAVAQGRELGYERSVACALTFIDQAAAQSLPTAKHAGGAAP